MQFSERQDGKKRRMSIIIRERYYTSIRSTTTGEADREEAIWC